MKNAITLLGVRIMKRLLALIGILGVAAAISYASDFTAPAEEIAFNDIVFQLEEKEDTEFTNDLLFVAQNEEDDLFLQLDIVPSYDLPHIDELFDLYKESIIEKNCEYLNEECNPKVQPCVVAEWHDEGGKNRVFGFVIEERDDNMSYKTFKLYKAMGGGNIELTVKFLCRDGELCVYEDYIGDGYSPERSRFVRWFEAMKTFYPPLPNDVAESIW